MCCSEVFFVCIVFDSDLKIPSVKVFFCTLITEQEQIKQTAVKQDIPPAWVPSSKSAFGKDIYRYAGQDIVIYESLDSYGAVMWPAVSTSEIFQHCHLQNIVGYSDNINKL